MPNINRSRYDSAKNLFTLPNVYLDFSIAEKRLAMDTTKSYQTSVDLYHTLCELAESKPWKFYPMNNTVTLRDTQVDGKTVCVVGGFIIYEDDEKLGTVSISWRGSQEKIIVDNDRINAKRERGYGYATDDPIKATLKIRKSFFRMANNERVKKVGDAARDALRNVSWDKTRKTQQIRNKLFEFGQEFIESHVSQYVQAYPQVAHHLPAFDVAHEEERVVDHMLQMETDRKAMLVIQDGVKYIVRFGDDSLNTYTDDTLPEDIRRKVGMLKLVEPGQVISNIGFKAEINAFIVVPAEAQDAE